MKKILTVLLVITALPVMAQHCGSCGHAKQVESQQTELKSVELTSAKKLFPLNEELFISYEWSKKPKIGTFILEVKVLDKEKNPVENVSITADAYMPSMKGSHDTGDQSLKVNKKGEHVIPVNFMMLGDWEILLKVSTATSQMNSAVIRLNI